MLTLLTITVISVLVGILAGKSITEVYHLSKNNFRPSTRDSLKKKNFLYRNMSK
jgi:hypothetical protein